MKLKFAHFLAGVLLFSKGVTELAIPWFERSPQWDWTIQTHEDLAGAHVNADVVQLGDDDIYLSKHNDRRISVISPPLTGLAAGRPVVEATLSRINGVQFAAAPPALVRVILFWQIAPNERFRMEETQVELSGDGSPARAMFLPPVDARTIHRIGVQVPDVREIRIRGIRMLDASVRQRADFFARELTREEPFGGESVNFYKGPSLLGRGLNHYLLAMCGVTSGIVFLRASRRRTFWSGLFLAVLLPWVAGDLFFSSQLVRRSIDEVSAVRSLDPDDAIRAVYGRDTAIAAEWLQVIPVGSRVSVLAEDSVTAAHRLAYLAVPRMVPVERPHDADYVVLLGGRASLLDERTLYLVDSKERLVIRIIARWDGCALVERVSD